MVRLSQKRRIWPVFRTFLILLVPFGYWTLRQLVGSNKSRDSEIGWQDFESESFRHRGRRSLLQLVENKVDEQVPNCTPPSINDFPSDGFSRSQRQSGFVALHVLLAVYAFLLLAIVCDDFFVPSITRICDRLKVSKDVAGATFMAAASSSPELFINIVGTFVTEGDLGVGTIVGSAVFNILAVPACCGLFTSQPLDLDWWPVSRDSVAYGVTVLLLIVTLRNGRVEWQEAFILVLFYCLYICVMVFNERIKRVFKHCTLRRRRRKYKNLSEDSPLLPYVDHSFSTLKSGKADHFFSTTRANEPGHYLYQNNGQGSQIDLIGSMTISSDDSSEIVNMTSWPDSSSEKAWWLLTWPINFLLLLTIPDCRRPSLRNWYPLTFVMCVVWIGLMSYLIGWDITIIGDTFGVPDSVMGLTFLAAGMSVPEAVSSIIVTNQGNGAMGIANSIGSNVFDVLLCLGLPWFIKSAFLPGSSGQYAVQINSDGLVYSSISLMSTLLILYVTLACNRFRLDRKVGCIFLATYVVFLVFASLIELNVFFVVNRPTCEH